MHFWLRMFSDLQPTVGTFMKLWLFISVLDHITVKRTFLKKNWMKYDSSRSDGFSAECEQHRLIQVLKNNSKNMDINISISIVNVAC